MAKLQCKELMDTEMNEKRIETEPYKGVRDFLPEDMAIQKYIFGIMRAVVESYGYNEYGASILEPSNLYKAKSSQEIVNEQTYTFTDRGDREVTLRPEMTPTVARMIAAHRHDLSVPIRWYSIPNLFRYERPQRGRLREHWQLNADIFGVSGIEADIEIISIAHDIMNAFGVKDEQFEIRVNNRQLMYEWFKKQYKITDETVCAEIMQTLDRKAKITEAAFKDKLFPIFQDKYDAFRKELDLDSESFVQMLNSELQNSALIRIKNILSTSGINNIVFDPTLVRGFSYYTGIVFEVFDKHESNKRALFGGGRYDNLMDVFGKDKVPAVGFGMGDVTMRDVLETYNLLPTYLPSAQLYLCHVGTATIDDITQVAKRLRAQGVSVAIDITERKLGDQIKAADKQKIPFVAVIGDEELTSKTYKIKHLSSGEEKTILESEITKTTLR